MHWDKSKAAPTTTTARTAVESQKRESEHGTKRNGSEKTHREREEEERKNT